MHDDTLRRTARLNPEFVTDLSYEKFQQVLDEKVYELDYQLISQIDVGTFSYPIRIPLLEEFFQVIKGYPERKLIIDIKAENDSIIASLSKLIHEYGIDNNQLIIIGVDLALLLKSKKIIPNVKHFLVTISSLRSLYDIFSEEERIVYKKLFSYLDKCAYDPSALKW